MLRARVPIVPFAISPCLDCHCIIAKEQEMGSFRLMTVSIEIKRQLLTKTHKVTTY